MITRLPPEGWQTRLRDEIDNPLATDLRRVERAWVGTPFLGTLTFQQGMASGVAYRGWAVCALVEGPGSITGRTARTGLAYYLWGDGRVVPQTGPRAGHCAGVVEPTSLAELPLQGEIPPGVGAPPRPPALPARVSKPGGPLVGEPTPPDPR